MRERYPEDEQRLPWLGMLLDACDIVEESVRRRIGEDVRERGMTLACAKGCAHCCREHPVPVTSLELAGLAWFILYRMEEEARARVLAALDGFAASAGCPLLLDGVCPVYPLRPLACRHFNVYGHPCRSGEAVTELRPGDVMVPDKAEAQRAYRAMLPYYGFTTPRDQDRALADNYLFTHSTLLHLVNWKAFLR